MVMVGVELAAVLLIAVVVTLGEVVLVVIFLSQ